MPILSNTSCSLPSVAVAIAFVEHPTQIERKQQHCSKPNNKNLKLTMVAYLQQQLVVLASSRCVLNFNCCCCCCLITVRERVRDTDAKLGLSVHLFVYLVVVWTLKVPPSWVVEWWERDTFLSVSFRFVESFEIKPKSKVYLSLLHLLE